MKTFGYLLTDTDPKPMLREMVYDPDLALWTVEAPDDPLGYTWEHSKDVWVICTH